MNESEFVVRIFELGFSPILAGAYLRFAEEYGVPLDIMHDILFPLLNCVDGPTMSAMNMVADQVYRENYGSIINPEAEEEV